MNQVQVLTNGLWKENPVLRLVLGMCPTLAVTTSVINGIGMGVCTMAVLLGANLVVSALRKVIPPQVRIPCFIIVIASFVTIVDLVMNAYAHELHKALGIFIPLIVVNCIILGRAEAFASRNGLWVSLLDAIGMGVGFTLALAVIGAIREILGNGTFLGISLFGPHFNPVIAMVLAPGAFITLGFVLAAMNRIDDIRAQRGEKRAADRRNKDCASCQAACPGAAIAAEIEK